MKAFSALVDPLKSSALFLVVVILAGCSSPPLSVDEIASSLKSNGISWDTRKKLDLSHIQHAKIDEAISIQGDDIHIDIFKITDTRTFKNMGKAVVLLAGAEQKVGQRLPGRPNVYIKEPFVIAVRIEPDPGTIREILDKLFD